jgi:hypothetical protein
MGLAAAKARPGWLVLRCLLLAVGLGLEPRLPAALGRALPAAHGGALDGAPRPRQMGPAAASAA